MEHVDTYMNNHTLCYEYKKLAILLWSSVTPVQTHQDHVSFVAYFGGEDEDIRQWHTG